MRVELMKMINAGTRWLGIDVEETNKPAGKLPWSPSTSWEIKMQPVHLVPSIQDVGHATCTCCVVQEVALMTCPAHCNSVHKRSPTTGRVSKTYLQMRWVPSLQHPPLASYPCPPHQYSLPSSSGYAARRESMSFRVHNIIKPIKSATCFRRLPQCVEYEISLSDKLLAPIFKRKSV
jgi:hypothetical protein